MRRGRERVSVIEIRNLTKYYGSNLVLDNVSFAVAHGEKIGLVGRNGTGKTTLLRIIAGLEDYDRGTVSKASNVEIGYLTQDVEFTPGNTLLAETLTAFSKAFKIRDEMAALEAEMADPKVHSDEAVLSQVMRRYADLSAEFERRGGYDYEFRTRAALFGLGFSEQDLGVAVDYLSGGQKMRMALAKLLLSEPDLLLLDEPTNHLDMDAVEWLEGYLGTYRGAVIVVSHDRYFLDATVERILDLDDHKIESYPGNYTFFVKEKELRKLQALEEWQRQQELIAKLEDYIRRYKAGNRTTMAQSREKMLARIPRKEKPRLHAATMNIDISGVPRSGREVVSLQRVGQEFDGRWLFRGFSMLVERGERIGLVGPNGSGKTTLLRIIGKALVPTEGTVTYGEGVVTGMFHQDMSGVDDQNTVVDEIYRAHPMTLGEARSYLARFLFRGDEVFKKVEALSGGERNRLLLAKLLLRRPNLLLLDEPTNHLDIEAREALERALAEFDGTVICASHDRYFLDRLATVIIEVANGEIRVYEGNYSYYREQKAKEKAIEAQAAQQGEGRGVGQASAKGAGGAAGARRGRKGVKASGCAQDRLAMLEEEIFKLEERLSKLTQALASPELYQNGEWAKEVVTEHREVEARLAELYEEWERAASGEV